MPTIHPTAVVDHEARLADDVVVGPYCVIEAHVKIGQGCVLRNHVTVCSYTEMGQNNVMHAHAVLGGPPQDLKFEPQTVSYLRIGDGNVFREGVTISRATGQEQATVVGNGTYWMANAHAGHNCVIGDGVILVNAVLLGGHCRVGPKAILAGGSGYHQFCWVGEMSMSQGHTLATMHVPPFVLYAQRNGVVGLNVVGLRRCRELSDEDRRQVKEAYRLVYRSRLTPSAALEQMDRCNDWGLAAGRFREFIRQVITAPAPFHRGLMPASP